MTGNHSGNDDATQNADAEFDNYSGTYGETVNSALSFSGLDVDFFTRVKADYIVEIAQDHFDNISHCDLLDVGCGVGNFHPLLTPHFNMVHGIDVSARSLDEAQRQNADCRYSHYNGERFPFADNSFDLVIGVCVLHHVPPPNWLNFASEMHRVLRKGGLSLVFEHNPLNPLSVHVVNNCPFDADAVLLRSKKTCALFEAAGFAHVAPRFILTLPAANRQLRFMDRLFSRMPLGAQYYVSGSKV